MGIRLKPVLEKDIKREIMRYLQLHGVLAWVNTSTGIFDAKRGTYRKLNGIGMRVGVSDILGIYHGKFLAIEVKGPTGRLTQEQALFLKDVNDHGGIAFMARSVDEVRTILAAVSV